MSDLDVFDNYRALHGRTAFDPGLGHRHLQQCSVNRDEFHNSLRLLAHKLNDSAEFLTLTSATPG